MCSGPSDHTTPLIKHNLTIIMNFLINVLMYYAVAERTGEQTSLFSSFLNIDLNRKAVTFSNCHF